MCEHCKNRNGLEKGDASSPLLFNFDPEQTIRKVQPNQKQFMTETAQNTTASAELTGRR
jgi:hypothetical protein